MVINSTFNNISAISWQSVLLVEEDFWEVVIFNMLKVFPFPHNWLDI